jgi:hypothetical protein
MHSHAAIALAVRRTCIGCCPLRGMYLWPQSLCKRHDGTNEQTCSTAGPTAQTQSETGRQCTTPVEQCGPQVPWMATPQPRAPLCYSAPVFPTFQSGSETCMLALSCARCIDASQWMIDAHSGLLPLLSQRSIASLPHPSRLPSPFLLLSEQSCYCPPSLSSLYKSAAVWSILLL